MPGYIGYKYVIYFIDDILGFIWLRFYVRKGNAAIQIKEFKKFIKI